jgi:hypothetical protein
VTLASQCYVADFADHVGSLEYHDLDGVRRSTALYRALFDDLAFDVVEPVAEGDRVASRFVVISSLAGDAAQFVPVVNGCEREPVETVSVLVAENGGALADPLP